MPSVVGLIGRGVAVTAAVGVLGLSVVGYVAQHSTALTPGDVQVLEGFSVEKGPGRVDAPVTAVDPVTKESLPVNILLLGSDSREGQGSGFGSADVYQGARSDTALLLHVAADRQSATAVSFPRDLRVDIPDCSEYGPLPDTRFNTAFDVGGAACTTTVVENLTGLTVDHVVVVDFRGFQAVVDSIGGVQVCLNEPVLDESSHLDLPAGWQNLDGKAALALARARKTLADGSDTARIGRQQALLKTAFTQVAEDGLLADPVRTYQVLTSVGDALSVSPSLSTTASMAALAAEMASLPPSKVKFTTVPWLPAGDNETVVLDPAKAPKFFEKLRADADDVAVTVVIPGSGTGQDTGWADDTATASPTPRPSKPAEAPTTVCGKDALF